MTFINIYLKQLRIDFFLCVSFVALLLRYLANAVEIDFLLLLKHSYTRSTSQCILFFLPPPPPPPRLPAVKIGGMLAPSAVTKSTRTLSDALWEPHISILSRFI